MKTDICLILEGTYPYVHGGVSSWIHKLVTSMSDLSFSIIHISSTGDVIKTPKYEIPPNILEFREVFVHDFHDDRSRTRGNKREGWSIIREFYKNLGQGDFSKMEKFYDLIINKKTRALNTHDIAYSKQGWEMMIELYDAMSPDVSFMDFYWTMRFIHIPIFNLFNVDIPDASLYHTVCTGYAGFLSVMAKVSKKAPLLLTEHGIYTHERKIDISQAQWIYSEKEEALRATRSLGFFKDFWIRKFEILSKMTYDYSDRIITLFEGNRRMQIEAGADPSKTMLIPNGVDFPEGSPKAARDKGTAKKTVGFVGRVVPIKDIKTFIRAMKIVQEKFNDVVVYILGSLEEEPEYANDCKLLIEMLKLEDNVVFTGVVNMEEYYPNLDVIVLTSISEAQPLSVLEAMSHGIPIVATDVGSCKELIMGRDGGDMALGKAGIITTVGNPYETANSVIRILEDDELREELSAVGKQRMRKYYGIGNMIESYKEIYGTFLNK